MTIATEPQQATSVNKLADPQQRLSDEMQRHADAVAKIQREMQDATREKAQSLLEGSQGVSADAPGSREPAAEQKRELTAEQKEKLLTVLQHRLSQVPDHYARPEGIDSGEVKRALEANPAALWSLSKMEETGGTPDIVAVEDDAFVFADCSAESPAGRRNCVYDKVAEESAGGTFNGNAVDMAEEFGVEMWSPEFYRQMQTLGRFDCRSWSWLKSDAEAISSGDARFGNRHGNCVEISRIGMHFHIDHGAWRGLLRVPKV